MCLSTPGIYNINNVNVDLAAVATNSEVFLPRFMIMRQRCMQVFKFGGPLDLLFEKYCIVLKVGQIIDK